MLGVLLAALVSAPPPPCGRLHLRAEVVVARQALVGRVRCELSQGGPVRAATYPRLLREPVAIDDVRHPWFYPSGFDRADMQLREGTRSLAGEGTWVDLGVRAAGETMELEFETRVPVRNGTFGIRDRAWFALGGWHPALAATDAADLEPQPIDYEVVVPEGYVGFIGSAPFGAKSPRRLRGTFTGRYLPLLMAPAAHVRRADAAVIIQPLPTPHEAGPREPPWSLPDVSAFLDARSLDDLEDTLHLGAEEARAHGVRPTALRVVLAPLRERFVEAFDGGFAVSDRLFHVLPLEVMRKFHRMGIWRAQLAALLEPHAALEPALPRRLAADAVAGALVDRLSAGLYGEVEHAAEMLEHVAVIPEIDALIFAPQVAFIDAYYSAIDETPIVRIHLDDFATGLPRGKLLYEKLVDAMGQAAAARLLGDYVRAGEPLLSLVAGRQGDEVARSLTQWLGPYPLVDYRIGEVRVQPDHVSVEVELSGPDAARVVEPVTVLVEDAEGHEHRAQRVGPGEVRLPAQGPPAVVQIDPDKRLVELHHEPGEAPRFNNRDPARWRFLLNNISGLFAITNRQLTAAVDFTLRRIHDLRHSFGFAAVYSPDAVGVLAGTSYAFGDEVTPLSLAQRVSLSVGYQRLLSEGPDDLPGDQVSASIGYGSDDRQSAYFAFRGKGLAFGAGGALGRDTGGGRYAFATVGGGAFYIQPLALGHSLLGRVRGDLLFGEPTPQSGLRLGGRYRGGRGYEIDEAAGDRRAVASLEYRHLLEGDARTDFFGGFMLTRIEGAVFGDAVYFPVDRPPTSSDDPTTPLREDRGCVEDVFGDVGYGLRFIGDVLNVSPSSLNLDIGFPLNRCPDQRYRVPFTIYATFVQSFAYF